jgi:hypothetical protein
MSLILEPAMLSHPAAAVAPDCLSRAGFVLLSRSAMAPDRALMALQVRFWLKRHAVCHPRRVVHENGIF